MLIFFILVAYVFTSLGWWSFLLLRKSREIYEVEVESLFHKMQNENPAFSTAAFYSSDGYHLLLNHYRHQIIMVVGEGIVVVLILVLGAWKVMQSFNRELNMIRSQKNFLL